MAPFLAMSVADVVADVLAFGAIAALATFGFRHGLFLAVVSALAVLTAFAAGVTLAPCVAQQLEAIGTSALSSLAVAYLVILCFMLVLVRLAVGGILTDEDARFHPLVDRFGGAAAGAFAGLILGGALLVGWSMCELPAGWRLNAPAMRWDSGATCLWALVRWLEPDSEKRNLFFQGDGGAKANGAKVILASEPFADADGDWQWDADESYLDYDENGKFTIDQEVHDHPHGSVDIRDAGLAERYWLSAWRTLRVLHRPRITSGAFNLAEATARAGETIYLATADDPDEQDEIEFTVTGEDAALLDIDQKTGEVRFVHEGIDPDRKKSRFTVVATDRSDLSDRLDVEITLRPPAGEAVGL